MADLSQVEQVLVATITQIVYPAGTGSPSVANTPVKVFRGWPGPTRLDADLKAGKINVSVFPQDTERRTTRYPQEWRQLSVPTPTLALTASNNTITVSGTPSSPLNAAAGVNGKAYVYPVQPGDTLATVATGLAALIGADTPATSSGPTITIPGAARLAATVGGVGTAIRELRRQRRNFQVTCWCPTPASRDLVASAIDAALAQIDFLTLPDGSAGRILYERSHVEDNSEREGLYRRDLFYSVEYGTTQTLNAAQIVAIVLNLTDWQGNPLPPRYRDPALLLEDGAYMRMEDGSLLLLEPPPPPHAAALLAEDGTPLRLEAGDYLLLEPPLRLTLEDGSDLLLEDSGLALIDALAPTRSPALGLESGGALLAEPGGALLLQ